ncbi:outer membrane protein assembly factor BamB family protein [Natronococcus wangiae]|uniref:outer membrane protein assembly factor BamB family protein n=1 Tax=Natronococcus wangiae TaxID=3068275 RepID=UPI00273D56A1|nr:PQQ-binding-like beta-propeller repeat protein [Natronococcus sp. AD5]
MDRREGRLGADPNALDSRNDLAAAVRTVRLDAGRPRLLVVGYDNSSSGLDEATVAALDRDTGDPIWEETLPQPVGPPAVADGVCYAGGGQTGYSEAEPGGLFALEVETGDLLWERDTAGSISGHALALVDDAIVFGTDEGVVVLE